jgi:hypothetical protein
MSEGKMKSFTEKMEMKFVINRLIRHFKEFTPLESQF